MCLPSFVTHYSISYTKRNILEIKKDYHCAEAKQGNVFPSSEIPKGGISVTVIMEN